jgi:hypothetical protein
LDDKVQSKNKKWADTLYLYPMIPKGKFNSPEISRSVEHSVILISKAGITRINGRLLVSQRGRSTCGDVTGYSGGRDRLAREGKASGQPQRNGDGWDGRRHSQLLPVVVRFIVHCGQVLVGS